MAVTCRELMLKAFQTSAVVMLVIGATGCLAWLITVEQVAVQLADWVQIVAHGAVDVPAADQRVACFCWASSSSRCRRCC